MRRMAAAWVRDQVSEAFALLEKVLVKNDRTGSFCYSDRACLPMFSLYAQVRSSTVAALV